MRTAPIYNFIIEATITASIAIALMLIVRQCFRKQLGNTVIYFAWLLIAIRLLCPLALSNPLIQDVRSFNYSDEAIRPLAGYLHVMARNDAERLEILANKQSESKNYDSAAVITWTKLKESIYDGTFAATVMKLYLAGVALVSAYFFVANLCFRRKLNANRIDLLSGNMLDQYYALCKERGISPIPVYYIDPLPSACLVGVFKPYIALPLTAKPQEVLSVLTHEVSHYQGRDHLWCVLRLVCCIVH